MDTNTLLIILLLVLLFGGGGLYYRRRGVWAALDPWPVAGCAAPVRGAATAWLSAGRLESRRGASLMGRPSWFGPRPSSRRRCGSAPRSNPGTAAHGSC